MATQNPALADWVKNAYSMEMSLVGVLEKQSKDAQTDTQLRGGIDRHLEATRHHVELLHDLLQRMGENTSSIQPANPLSALYSMMDGQPDATFKTGLMDFVTENFEVASYRALSTLAMQMGDQETAQIADRILQDELAMVRSLDQVIRPLNAEPQAMAGGAAGAVSEKENIRIAQDSFDALNAHDLDRWMRPISDDYYSDAPGAPMAMDKQQNRQYLQNFVSAFPDLHFDVLRTIAQADHVVCDWEATATHSGPLQSPGGKTIPATNKRVKEFGSTTFEIKDGKIHRSWVYYDMSELMHQLGRDMG